MNPEHRSRDLIRAAVTLALCVLLTGADRVLPDDPVLLPLWPLALAPLYGVRTRYVVEGCWALAVILIAAAAWPVPIEGDWRGLVPTAGAIVVVSLTALGVKLLSLRDHRLRQQAYVDPLTGVLNRRSFLELSGKEESRTRRRAYELGVLMIDIDHFKKINDTYGHSAGDAVIRRLADICSRALRPSDLVARYGGEEFVISLPETGLEHAQLVAGRLRESVAATIVAAEGHEIRFTVSIGIAICSRESSLNAAMRQADEALYVAKRNGRNRVELATVLPATIEVAAPDLVKAGLAAVDLVAADLVTAGAPELPPPTPRPGPSSYTARPGTTQPGAARGTGRILIVDDEAEIRVLIADWLGEHGYQVLVAACAADALRLIETDATIELLCTDIVMPGDLNGFDLARRAEEIRPGIKLLYMSAYSVAETVRAAQGEAPPLMHKPFRLDYLLETIENALA